jgi:hypothetical protein
MFEKYPSTLSLNASMIVFFFFNKSTLLEKSHKKLDISLTVENIFLLYIIHYMLLITLNLVYVDFGFKFKILA